MDVFMITCLIIIGIAVAFLYPPVFLVILLIAAPKIGILPSILYMFFMVWLYSKKKKV